MNYYFSLHVGDLAGPYQLIMGSYEFWFNTEDELRNIMCLNVPSVAFNVERIKLGKSNLLVQYLEIYIQHTDPSNLGLGPSIALAVRKNQ